MQKGFCSGSPDIGYYLGIQIAGAVAITAWTATCTLLFFVPLTFCGWHKYHPVIEMLGAPRLKMGELNSKFLIEMREMFGGNKGSKDRMDTENQAFVKKENCDCK